MGELSSDETARVELYLDGFLSAVQEDLASYQDEDDFPLGLVLRDLFGDLADERGVPADMTVPAWVMRRRLRHSFALLAGEGLDGC